MSYDKDEIKAKTNCADVLHSRGIEWSGKDIRCPFPDHMDASPSFGLIENGEAFKCHGCGRGGDVFSLVEHLEGKDFAGAINWLGNFAGLKPKQYGPRKAKRPVAIYDYCDLAGKTVFQVCRFEPKGFSQRRPNPEKPGQWINSMKGVTRFLYRLPEITHAIARGEKIFLVEGEKDVAALVSLGFEATTSPGGSDSWKKEYAETLNGADVVLLPDKDEAGKKYAKKVLGSLDGVAKSIVVFELPNRNIRKVKDAADWVQAGGTREEMIALVNNPPSWEKPKDGRAETSANNGKKGGRKPAPPAAKIAAEYANDELLTDEGVFSARHYRESWYVYRNGWEPRSEMELEKRVMTYLQNRIDLAIYATPTYARNIIHNLASFNLCGIDTIVERPSWLSTGEDARNWMAFANGVAIDVWKYAECIANGSEPKDHKRKVSPDLFSGDFVGYDWNPDAIPIEFIKYLERVQPDAENFNAIRCMMGVLLADCAKYETFWQLYGHGANGKTVLLDIIEKLVGRQNVCRVSLEALAPGTRFQAFPLAIAKVNICGELPTDLGKTTHAAIEGELKHATSGGTITIERKGIDKTEERCRARFVMSGNSLPSFFDRSDAIWRRLRILPFNVQIPEGERDPDLAARIIENELPAIAVWALDGLAEVIKMGRIPDSTQGVEMKSKHRETCDHESAFLLESYERGGDGDKVRAADIYSEYRDWTGENGYGRLGSGKFHRRIEEIFPGLQRRTIRIGPEICKGYLGLRRVSKIVLEDL